MRVPAGFVVASALVALTVIPVFAQDPTPIPAVTNREGPVAIRDAVPTYAFANASDAISPSAAPSSTLLLAPDDLTSALPSPSDIDWRFMAFLVTLIGVAIAAWGLWLREHRGPRVIATLAPGPAKVFIRVFDKPEPGRSGPFVEFRRHLLFRNGGSAPGLIGHTKTNPIDMPLPSGFAREKAGIVAEADMRVDHTLNRQVAPKDGTSVQVGQFIRAPADATFDSLRAFARRLDGPLGVTMEWESEEWVWGWRRPWKRVKEMRTYRLVVRPKGSVSESVEWYLKVIEDGREEILIEP